MPRLTHRIAIPVALFATLALVPPVAAALDASWVLTLVTRLMIFAIAVVSLDLVLGVGGLVSFGHAAFVGIGAYAVGILAYHGLEDAALSLPVAILAAMLFALVTGAIAMRTRGVYFIMITLAFGQMAYFIGTSLSAYGGDDGLTIWTRNTLFGADIFSDRTIYYFVVWGALLLTFLACTGLVATRFGRVLRAVRENEQRVVALGFDPYRIRLVAYVISGGFAGLAGGLLANHAEFVSPAYMTWQRSGEFIVMAVLGGMGTLYGAILGTAAYVLMEEVLAHFTLHWKMIFGPLLILVVLYARGGLAALLERAFPPHNGAGGRDG